MFPTGSSATSAARSSPVPPTVVEKSSEVHDSDSRKTKASSVGKSGVSMGRATGKSPDAVQPATCGLPCGSRARPSGSSVPLPPTTVKAVRAEPSAPSRATKMSFWPPGPIAVRPEAGNAGEPLMTPVITALPAASIVRSRPISTPGPPRKVE